MLKPLSVWALMITGLAGLTACADFRFVPVVALPSLAERAQREGKARGVDVSNESFEVSRNFDMVVDKEHYSACFHGPVAVTLEDPGQCGQDCPEMAAPRSMELVARGRDDAKALHFPLSAVKAVRVKAPNGTLTTYVILGVLSGVVAAATTTGVVVGSMFHNLRGFGGGSFL